MAQTAFFKAILKEQICISKITSEGFRLLDFKDDSKYVDIKLPVKKLLIHQHSQV